MSQNKINIILKSAILVVCLAGCSERLSEYYSTYEVAEKRGAIQSGWIPASVPRTATAIYEQHDLDSNEVWLRFNLPADERDKLVAGLRNLTNDEILKIKLRYPNKVNWWFEGLSQQSPANDNALNADIYKIKEEKGKTAYLAIERNSSKVYYWNAY